MIVSLMQYYKALKGQSFNEVTCMITHDQLHAHAKASPYGGIIQLYYIQSNEIQKNID